MNLSFNLWKAADRTPGSMLVSFMSRAVMELLEAAPVGRSSSGTCVDS